MQKKSLGKNKKLRAKMLLVEKYDYLLFLCVCVCVHVCVLTTKLI